MTEFLIKTLDLFRWFFRLLGVDYEKFRILLWAKLTVDNRQEKSIAQRRSKKEMSNSLALVALVYAFMGIFMGILLLQMQSVFTAMIFVFSMVMVMTAVALISDFTSVLLDTTDNAILMPRPVDSRTLSIARITHIVIYILIITLALTAASIVIGTVKYGPLFTLVFLAALIFSVLFVVFFANVFYLLLMKISTGEHFRDVILYFQIFMAAFAMGSYQLLPRLMDVDVMQGFKISIQWWTYLVPPAWMAAPIDMAVTGDFSGAKLLMALTGLIVPVGSIFFVVRFLAPGFSRALSQMESAGPSLEIHPAASGKSLNLPDFLARVFTSASAERTAFQLSWKLSSRDRKFKLRTYPTFGYMLIIAFVLSIYRSDNILQNIRSLPSTEKYLIFLYIGCLLIPIVVMAQRYSDQYEASWIYRTLPFASPGDIQKGSLKAMVIKYGASVFIPLAVFVLLVWGFRVLDDIVLAFSNMLLTSLAIGFMVRGDLPFSRKYVAAAERQRGLTGFLLFIVPAATGGIHYALSLVPYAVPVALILSLIAVYLGMNLYGKMSWEAIKS